MELPPVCLPDDGRLVVGRVVPAGVIDARAPGYEPRRARRRIALVIADRRVLDVLVEVHRITREEHEAGIFFAGAATNGGRAAAMIYRALTEALDEVEIDLAGLLVAVCVRNQAPKTVDGIDRMREALQIVSRQCTAIERDLDLPRFAADEGIKE